MLIALLTVTDWVLLPEAELRVIVLLDGIVTTVAFEMVEQVGVLLTTTL